MLEPGDGLEPAVPATSPLAREHAVADVPVVPPEADRTEILRILSARRYPSAAPITVHHHETALPVVTREGRFLGIIPPLTLLQVLLQEYEEDLSRLGGYLRSTALARAGALEKVFRRFGHRLPWLLVGLLGGVLSFGIVARYEEALRNKLVLACFLPAIVHLADAVGTQTETLLVRGMSVGVQLRQVVVRELLTGLPTGKVARSTAAECKPRPPGTGKGCSGASAPPRSAG